MVTPDTFVEYFNSEKFKEIYDTAFEPFKQNTEESRFVESLQIFHREAGDLHQKYHNKLTMNFNRYFYVNDDETHSLTAAFTDDNEIIGIELYLNEKYDTDDVWTKNEYALPLEEAVVSAGGTDVFHNYHYRTENQRYAYDLTNMVELYHHNGDPGDLNSYFVFGSDVLAPLDGVVVDVKRDVKDNQIGIVNQDEPSGNYVIIEHENGEYSLLAHLKKDSVQVDVGDSVVTGELVGQVGNSGATTLPHLHFQVMSDKELNKDSIRIRFKDFESLKQGDRVE
ncbi:hypothetical protein HMPREF2767_07695 [Nosocomiicoccus sp. HMSC067E10]|uniref:M23 family metallopeptidase n=1 Tax=Nosocomiicoccus sp. HMSC067E10 TaxID=1739271 RepID=UPI0008A3B858|nr:M23 family metallopeptidase [Nosocomiicoccus sp. HMSC067E10]OFL48644.1 hypothetical protein HMPREF2767_07695 [Nosocomiicoccus sp. HMSC067E10]